MGPLASHSGARSGPVAPDVWASEVSRNSCLLPPRVSESGFTRQPGLAWNLLTSKGWG